MGLHMVNGKHQSLQDLYFDGIINGIDDDFCEDTQEIVDYSWNREEEFDDEIEYWVSLDMDDADDLYIRMLRGEIKRIR